MRGRLLAGVTALGLALGGTGMAAEIDDAPFWWDVQDADITSQSNGTGGGPADKPGDAERGERLFSIEWTGPAEGWRKQVYGELPVTWEACVEVDGQLLFSMSLVELPGDTFRLRAGGIDPATERMLTLSDLFYDGVNYIDYINREAQRALMGETIYEGRDRETGWYQPGERNLRRPFSGFPRDYPYFQICEEEHGRRLLGLLIDEENPLFAPPLYEPLYELWIPLPAALSPYGAPWAEMGGSWKAFEREGHSMRIYLARAVPGADLGEAQAARINDVLEELAGQAEDHPASLVSGAGAGIYPAARFADRFMSVTYGGMPMFSSAVFDIETGWALDGRAVTRDFGEDERAAWHRTGAAYGYALPPGGALAETPSLETARYQGSTLFYQPTPDGDGRFGAALRVTFREWDGSEVHLVLPWEVLTECGDDCWRA